MSNLEQYLKECKVLHFKNIALHKLQKFINTKDKKQKCCMCKKSTSNTDYRYNISSCVHTKYCIHLLLALNKFNVSCY